ncbi:MAG: LysM peptidoglycan-binding domain-containing protein [Acidobacteria bacterium]|nr:LysM peptidoglycan-binding domain-containing protein [Acidobacteriota bacterium]
MQGAAEERDGKLHFHGTVQNQEEANRIWDAIKTVPSWRTDIIADIRPLNTAPAAAAQSEAAAQTAPQTYTVKSGDTLSKIAKEFLGSAGAYMEVFNANRDQLSDPDKIKVGQVLKIPAKH